jgi:hypothetical protein
MSKNSVLDLEKVEAKFEEMVTSGNDKELAEFAREVIPLLIQDARQTRMEVVNLLLKK